MADTAGDGKRSLNSAASSETLVSVAGSTTSATISKQFQRSTEASFYKPGFAGDDEMSPLDQFLSVRRDHHCHTPASSSSPYHTEGLTSDVNQTAPTDLSCRTNWGFLRNHKYRSSGSRTSRLEDQDALPHPSHRNKRTLVVNSPPPLRCNFVMPRTSAYPKVDQPVDKVVVLGENGVGKRYFITQVCFPHYYFHSG